MAGAGWSLTILSLSTSFIAGDEDNFKLPRVNSDDGEDNMVVEFKI